MLLTSDGKACDPVTLTVVQRSQDPYLVQNERMPDEAALAVNYGVEIL